MPLEFGYTVGGAIMDVRQGGNQIEYEDQNPRIHAMYEEAMARVGLKPNMEAFIKP